ncbi:MAG: SpoIVB peptidase S55 domain-containing protein [Clostridia bacterium]
MKKYLLIPIILIIIILTVIFNKSITVSNFNDNYILGGDTVGVKLLATGVLVIDIDDSDSKLKIGDVILKVNNNKLSTNRELKEYGSKGSELNLEVVRDNKNINIKMCPKLNDITKEYNLGLWVKDSSAGVGTITFYDSKTGKFASLGHGITETKKNYIVPISSGAITSTTVYGIERGVSDIPRRD